MEKIWILSLIYVAAMMASVEAFGEVYARVILSGVSGVSGTLNLTQMNDEMLISGCVVGLTPGLHGFHVHQWGDIFSRGCDSAGPHYNPRNMEHGAPEDEVRHVGDTGNIEADESGIAEFKMVDRILSLVGPESIAGRSFVVHSNRDDLGRGGNRESKITGNSGSRVACGIIALVPNH